VEGVKEKVGGCEMLGKCVEDDMQKLKLYLRRENAWNRAAVCRRVELMGIVKPVHFSMIIILTPMNAFWCEDYY